MRTKIFFAGLLFCAVTSISCNSYAVEEKDKPEADAVENSSKNVEVLQVWNLPDELKEISANVLVDDRRMACVEDNAGVIYIYNLDNKKIESKISFAGKGDFEGLALVDKTYYVLRSDGALYEVVPSDNGDPVVKTYDLPFDQSNDTESLFYDQKQKRLLIGVKEKDLSPGNTKGIYSFDLSKKVMSTEAVFSIEAGQSDSEKKKSKKGGGSVKPSEIVLNAKTNELYVLNGPRSQLLIADENGHIKSSIDLPKDIFPQPEGMCFSSLGELYISSEGTKKRSAVIAKVQL